MTHDMSKTVTFHDSYFAMIFLILLFTGFDASKCILESFFAFFRENMKQILQRLYLSRLFGFRLFDLMTWDDLDLY